jgi:probable F420-dependent oxidoreductase
VVARPGVGSGVGSTVTVPVMELGVVLPQTEIGPDPADLVRFVGAADAAGFTHVVVYDHVVGADRATRPDWPGPYDLHSSFHEPFVLYGYLAARTRMELVTGVIILPQRQAVLVAKQAAEVDVLTGGRFRLGVGIGWNPVEFDALGMDFRNRARRYEEQIEVMRLLWTQESVTFEGRYHSIDNAGLLPRPVQQPIPIWMGGGLAPATLDRIGRLADGWICNTPPGHGLEEALEVVRAAAMKAGRAPDAIGLHGIAQPRDADDTVAVLRRQVGKWEALGATHVSVSGLYGGRSPREHADFVEMAAAALLG